MYRIVGNHIRWVQNEGTVQNRQWKHSRMHTLTHSQAFVCGLFFSLAKNYDTWWCACFGWAYMIMLCLFCLQVSSLFRAIFASCIVRHRGMFDRVQFCVNAFTSRFLPQFCRDKHSRTHTLDVKCCAYISFQSIWYCFDFERERARASAMKIISMPFAINDVKIIVQFDEEEKIDSEQERKHELKLMRHYQL